MNIQDTANTKSAYAIGQPVKRKEDGKLLRGQGRYTDDVDLPNRPSSDSLIDASRPAVSTFTCAGATVECGLAPSAAHRLRRVAV